MGPEALILHICGIWWVVRIILYNIPILDGVIWCILYGVWWGDGISCGCCNMGWVVIWWGYNMGVCVVSVLLLVVDIIGCCIIRWWWVYYTGDYCLKGGLCVLNGCYNATWLGP